MARRTARVEDVDELAAGMPHVTVEADGRVYQVGGKSLQLLAGVRDSAPAPQRNLLARSLRS